MVCRTIARLNLAYLILNDETYLPMSPSCRILRLDRLFIPAFFSNTYSSRLSREDHHPNSPLSATTILIPTSYPHRSIPQTTAIMVNPQITNLAIILGMMQVSKKIPFEDPQVLLGVRVLYVVSNLIIFAIYYYISMQIKKKKGEPQQILPNRQQSALARTSCASALLANSLLPQLLLTLLTQLYRSHNSQVHRTSCSGHRGKQIGMFATSLGIRRIVAHNAR